MSTLDSKVRVVPLACFSGGLHMMYFSDSALVPHLPTSWQPAWLLNQFEPFTFSRIAELKLRIEYAAGRCSI